MLSRYIDLTTGNVSHAERLISALGGFIAIYAIYSISNWQLGPTGVLVLVPSMGASAVLLFAVPHGALSQPWNLVGGHLVSAVIGVSCYLAVPHTIAAASLAVGLAIGAMYYLRCIHPPGGATALAAVISGEQAHTLGYNFVLTPVMLNVAVMLLTAIIFNYAFKWRRYPSLPEPRQTQAQPHVSGNRTIDHADMVAALSQIDSFIDVSERDLLRIYKLATGQGGRHGFPTERILPGHYYSNGAYGEDWAVRQVIDESASTDPEKDMVIYKVVAGRGFRSTGVQTRREFTRWTRHELVRDGDNWKRIETPASHTTDDDSLN